MSSSPETSHRKSDGPRQSQFCPRLLAVVICGLAALLIIQVVILVRNSQSNGPPLIEDGDYAMTATSCGFVKGLVFDESYEFLGIPYAIPPVQNRRWLDAEVHDDLRHCWNGTYLATERKKRCWQFYRNGSYDGAEDCLYLDVFTPQIHSQNPLDVIVFVGGENLNGGESFDVGLQPTAATAKERNAVFVSVSLRRSVLGFLSLKALSQRTRLKSSGNYGVSDLLASLLWIRLNIRYFGGNPNSVTVLGHQSGATILAALLKSGMTSQLFHKVWMSGGSFLDPITLEQAEEENLKFLEYTECESLSCLFRLSPEEVLDSVPYTWRQFHHELSQPNSFSEGNEHFWLTYDGHIIPNKDDKDDDFAEGVFPAKGNNNNTPLIPVVVGSPQHIDASLEMRTYLNWNLTEKYREHLESSFDTPFAIQAYHQYNRPDTNHWQQFSALLSDYKTICPMLKMSQNYLRSNLVFNYITTHRNKGGFGNLAKAGSDIQAIFRPTLRTRSFKDAKFKENMLSLFDSFVKTGSVEDNQIGGILMIDDRIGKVQEYSNCDLWFRYYDLKAKFKTKPRRPSYIITPRTPAMDDGDNEFGNNSEIIQAATAEPEPLQV